MWGYIAVGLILFWQGIGWFVIAPLCYGERIGTPLHRIVKKQGLEWVHEDDF